MYLSTFPLTFGRLYHLYMDRTLHCAMYDGRTIRTLYNQITFYLAGAPMYGNGFTHGTLAWLGPYKNVSYMVSLSVERPELMASVVDSHAMIFVGVNYCWCQCVQIFQKISKVSRVLFLPYA
jgi:hypothetical protein